jgi:hypothetical protein
MEDRDHETGFYHSTRSYRLYSNYPASSNPSGRDRGPLAGPCLVIRIIVLIRSGAAGPGVTRDW